VVDDVGPEHDLPTVPRREVAQAQDVPQVEPPLPEFGRQRARLAGAEIPGLVAIDVEPFRGEVRQEIAVEIGEQGVGALLRRGQRPLPADLVQVGLLR